MRSTMTSPSDELHTAGQEDPLLTQDEVEPVHRPVNAQETDSELDDDEWLQRRQDEADLEHHLAEETAQLQERTDSLRERLTALLGPRGNEAEPERWEDDEEWQQPPPLYQDALSDEVYRPGPEESQPNDATREERRRLAAEAAEARLNAQHQGQGNEGR
jgi:hypothetical protein